MNFVAAAKRPPRNTGQIKIHEPARRSRACARPASWRPRAWTCWSPEAREGVATGAARRSGAPVRARPRRAAGLRLLPRLSPHAVHVAQPRRLPRHSRRARAEGRRHRQHRRHRHRRRLARRYQPHVRHRRRAAQSAAADGRDLRSDDARHRRDQAGRDARRSRPRHPILCRRRALLGRARVLRPRAGPASSTTRRTSCTSAGPAKARS